jgi:hypothetical protein
MAIKSYEGKKALEHLEKNINENSIYGFKFKNSEFSKLGKCVACYNDEIIIYSLTTKGLEEEMREQKCDLISIQEHEVGTCVTPVKF